MRIIAGIYSIVNQNNGKTYIGSSKNIIRRWGIHKSALKNNRHHCIHLQRSWNKHGPDAFKFEVIVEMTNPSEKLLLAEELKVISERLPQYNIGAVGGGDNLTNNPNRDDIIRRMTASLRERIDKMSDEERKRMWSHPGDKNPNWKGGVSTPKCNNCGKQLGYGHKKCVLCSKLGIHNPFYGKSHSKTTKKYLSEINKGVLPPNTNPITLNGIAYKSQHDAARQLGVSNGTISNWIRGKTKPQRSFLSPDVTHIQST